MIALVCLHSGVFTRSQFCHYFNTYRKHAYRFVKLLVERRAAVESELPRVNGGGMTCRISSNRDLPGAGSREHPPPAKGQQAGCHAAAFVAGFCAGASGYELAPRRAGEGRVF